MESGCSTAACCNPEALPPESQPMPLLGSAERAVFLIQKMDCPTEERLIRGKLEGMAGIEALSFNLIQRELTVMHRLPSAAPLVTILKALDLDPV